MIFRATHRPLLLLIPPPATMSATGSPANTNIINLVIRSIALCSITTFNFLREKSVSYAILLMITK